ncbi:MAG: hypothetical protein J6N93_08275 [Clostridia bacterium]|nr:hypothetical protein [Clostridia bacterium]
MSKTRMKKLFIAAIVALSIATGLCSICFNLNTTANAAVNDEAFTAIGGTYTLGQKTDASEDGLPLNVKPSAYGSDVTLVFNGAYWRMNYNGASTWAGRTNISWSEQVSATAIVASMKSTDFIKPVELTWVFTPTGTYFPLIDDVSFNDAGEPYITGTEQYLVKWATGSSTIGLKSFMHLQLSYSEENGNNDVYIKINDAADVKNNNVFSLYENNWIDNSSAKLPSGLKERYDRDKLFNYAKNLNKTKFSLKFVGLTGEAKAKIRMFNGRYYYSGVNNTYLQNTTFLALPAYTTLIKNKTYDFRKLFDIYGSNQTKKGGLYGFYKFDTSVSWNWNGSYGLGWNKYDVNTSGQTALSIIAQQQADPSTNYAANGTYTYASFDFVERADEVIAKKDVELKWGETYKASDLFTDKLGGGLGNYKITGTAVGADGSSEEVDLGYIDGTGDGWTVGVYSSETKPVKLSVKVTMKEFATAETSSSDFDFYVDENAPEISFIDRAMIEGYEFDLSEFVLVHFVGEAETEYSIDGKIIPEGKYLATEGTKTLSVKVTDSRGYSATAEKLIKVLDFGLNNVEGDFERNTTTYFPDPAISDDSMLYNVELLNENGDVLSTSTRYVFEEDGVYRLVYHIILGDNIKIDKTVTYVVTIVEQMPEITVRGEYKDSYYTGMVITVFSAIAANSYKSFPIDVKITANGINVAAIGNELKLSAAGEYKIVYSAKADDERTATKEFCFNVIKDDEAPVIVVEGNYDSSYAAGTTLNLLGVNVSDNSGEDISAEIQVYKNGNRENVSGASVKIESGASYKVVYIAEDMDGNRATKEFEFKAEGKGEANNKGGCGSSIANGCTMIMLLGLSAVAFILIMGRREKYEK